MEAPTLLVHRAVVRPAQRDQVGHPVASCEQLGRSEQKARASINLLLQVGPRNSKRYSRLDRVKLLSISPIVDEACVVVDWAGFGNYARQGLSDARK
jgi:hypothetical protein